MERKKGRTKGKRKQRGRKTGSKFTAPSVISHDLSLYTTVAILIKKKKIVNDTRTHHAFDAFVL